MKLLSDIGPRIEQLQRTKEIEENNYKYFQASLEKARVDEALDPSKMPNISIVQSPSTAFRVTGTVKKMVLGLAGGGIGLGIGLAFLIELILNRTVKRPLELETLLGLPIWLSIPYLNGQQSLCVLTAERACVSPGPALKTGGLPIIRRTETDRPRHGSSIIQYEALPKQFEIV